MFYADIIKIFTEIYTTVTCLQCNIMVNLVIHFTYESNPRNYLLGTNVNIIISAIQTKQSIIGTIIYICLLRKA